MTASSLSASELAPAGPPAANRVGSAVGDRRCQFCARVYPRFAFTARGFRAMRARKPMPQPGDSVSFEPRGARTRPMGSGRLAGPLSPPTQPPRGTRASRAVVPRRLAGGRMSVPRTARDLRAASSTARRPADAGGPNSCSRLGGGAAETLAPRQFARWGDPYARAPAQHDPVSADQERVPGGPNPPSSRRHDVAAGGSALAPTTALHGRAALWSRR